ncbi:MAG: hypothetical protein HYZ20_05345 [Burkholderiales bacterium]|nr:hypothetical protein [Burkholderiales bacterium]
MHARRLISIDDSNEVAVPTCEQPPTGDATSTLPRTLPRTHDLPSADLPGVADDPGEVEYASWIRLLRIPSA